MRVLVTGAGGFIGREVVAALAARQHEVIAADRTADQLQRVSRQTPTATTIALDLADTGAFRVCLRDARPDAIIHLAWYADPSDYLVSHENLASLAMTTRLVETALQGGCRKLIAAGSCVEYRVLDRPLKEDDAAGPSTLYGACKHAASVVSQALAAETSAELAWARVFHLHGPGENARRLIPWVARELAAGRAVDLTDGRQVRDHLHVGDVAAGLIALLAPGAAGIYNVCSGEPVTLRTVLETVGDIVGRRELLRFGARPHRDNETMFLAGDSTRLRATGWSPRFGLEDGLRDAVAGVLAHS
jgi:nucleoside-diphosphate-sugar epimerase